MDRKQAQQKAQKAALAAQFNEFYLDITSPSVTQIGCYRIVREIGEGAFGKVYLASHLLLNVKVVLKCGLLDDPNIVREVFYHKQLRHKNIVKLYEVIKTETHLWLVMEYCEGNELFYHIYEKRRLGYDEAQRVFAQIVLGLAHVHKLNLSHRDLKLENILLADKRKTVVKLTDFGFVREYDPRLRTLLSTVCGTTVYMAPELLKNDKYSGFAADIWALGVILYTMMYGVMPFDEDDDLRTKFKIVHDEPEYRPGVANDVVLLIQRMLCKDPRQRATLAEIQSSSFLTDPTAHRRSRSSIHTDAGSIVSITQWNNDRCQPFESKLERHLLKRLRKLNIDVDQLKASVLDNRMDSLTAFYELALKHQLDKKRLYRKRKRYSDARMSLRRSRDRFRSALSLADQGGSQPPLERIMSTLSIGLARNGSRTNLAKVASPRRSVDTQLKRYSMDEKKPVNLERSVSFYPETDRPPAKGGSISSEDTRRSKNSKLLNKLQFWKRAKNPDDRPENHAEQTSHKLDDVPAELSRPPALLLDGDVNSPSPRSGGPPPASPPAFSNAPLSTRHYRTRPSSVISQQSQASHASQLLAMMSELELEMETDLDSMDEYAEYDEDGAYESSINASQNELQGSRAPLGTPTEKRRPSYRRNVSSDMSIVSVSTAASQSLPRLRHHLGHRKRSLMSRLSSNSSDEGQRLKRADVGSRPLAANPASDFRPPTPDLQATANGSSGMNGHANGHSDLPVPFSTSEAPNGASSRPLSPPATRVFQRTKPKASDAAVLHEKHRGGTPGTGGYETKFVIIDEEDED